MRRRVTLALVVPLALLAGCDRFGGEDYCTLVDAQSGVSISVDAAFAPKVDAAVLSVCRGELCDRRSFTLRRTADVGSLVGKKFDRITIAGLRDDPARISLTISDAKGQIVADRTLDVTPSVSYPNGKGCGPRVVSVALVVDAAGTITSTN